jgi:fatty-acid desaturase
MQLNISQEKFRISKGQNLSAADKSIHTSNFIVFPFLSKGIWLIYASGQGVTMGAHRLFCHKSFKAQAWLRITLLWMHTLAGQVSERTHIFLTLNISPPIHEKKTQ